MADRKPAVTEEEAITQIARGLYRRFGRPPTDEEVTRFVLGDHRERDRIWNFGIPKPIKKD
jgi:hypothetical protein